MEDYKPADAGLSFKVMAIDIDGTLSDSRTRGVWSPARAHEWHEEFANDPPVQSVVDLIKYSEYNYIIISSKPSSYKEMVKEWIGKHRLHMPMAIYMRPCGNLDVSPTLKRSMISRARSNGFKVVLGVDDRADCCEAYISMGIPAFQLKQPRIPQTRLL